jgi:hypothetical protein
MAAHGCCRVCPGCSGHQDASSVRRSMLFHAAPRGTIDRMAGERQRTSQFVLLTPRRRPSFHQDDLPGGREYVGWLLRRGIRSRCGIGRIVLARESDRPLAHIARDQGVHPEALRNSVRQDEAGRGARADQLSTAEPVELCGGCERNRRSSARQVRDKQIPPALRWLGARQSGAAARPLSE